jgi:hypothetical protein
VSDKVLAVKKIIVSAVIGGTAVLGLGLGAGSADAEIEPGHYTSQGLIYGFVPTPEYNTRVVGNRMYSDYYGLGPQNLFTSTISPTRHGGNVYGGADPVTRWLGHDEYRKTRSGYVGTRYIYGQIPYGNVLMKKTPRQANQAH